MRHDTDIETRSPKSADWRSRGVCSCGWLGPWRKTQYTYWFCLRDGNKHARCEEKARQRKARFELERAAVTEARDSGAWC